MNSTVAEIADRERAADRGRFAQWHRQYNVTVTDGETHHQTWRVEYAASDREEAREILRSGQLAFKADTGRHSVVGIHVVMRIDGQRETITDLKRFCESSGIRSVLRKYGLQVGDAIDDAADSDLPGSPAPR